MKQFKSAMIDSCVDKKLISVATKGSIIAVVWVIYFFSNYTKTYMTTYINGLVFYVGSSPATNLLQNSACTLDVNSISLVIESNQNVLHLEVHIIISLSYCTNASDIKNMLQSQTYVYYHNIQ